MILNQQPSRQAVDSNNWRKSLVWQASICSVLILLASIRIEHSSLDVWISSLFFQHHTWLIDKHAEPWSMLFYDAPKRLLIIFELYLLAVWFGKKYIPENLTTNSSMSLILPSLSLTQLSYLIITTLLIPTSVAALKTLTHVPCPYELQLFGGHLLYTSLSQDILMSSDARCFPAAHASAGFALYALVFLVQTWQQRVLLSLMISALGWTMGGYKMLIGDHFFSHTLVSMLLAWGISALMAWWLLSTDTKNQ